MHLFEPYFTRGILTPLHIFSCRSLLYFRLTLTSGQYVDDLWSSHMLIQHLMKVRILSAVLLPSQI